LHPEGTTEKGPGSAFLRVLAFTLDFPVLLPSEIIDCKVKMFDIRVNGASRHECVEA